MKKVKPLQTFSLPIQKLDPNAAAEFLDQYQSLLAGEEGERKLISIRVPEKLLELFREKADRRGVKYQTQIVELMRSWL